MSFVEKTIYAWSVSGSRSIGAPSIGSPCPVISDNAAILLVLTSVVVDGNIRRAASLMIVRGSKRLSIRILYSLLLAMGCVSAGRNEVM